MANWTAKKRRNLPLSSFGDPANRKFPVTDQEDLDSAAHLIGHASNPEAVKKRIIRIAKRLGLSLPDAWKEDAKKLADAPGLEYKTFPTADFKAIDETQGICECVVAVFGNVDRGGDRILPGFFAKSLRVKLPKGVWMHDWKVPVAKTLDAHELMPGDIRLPEKIRSLGGLYIKGQFNLDTQRGREAFSDLRFGSVDEFSIGYATLRDKVDGKTGVRDLIEGTVYEWSPVLVGMNSQTALLSTKDADMDADPDSKALSEGTDDQGGATVPEAGDHVKWGAYAKGMAAGCGTVKSVHVKGPIGGMEASDRSPVVAVYKCKAVKPPPSGDADEVETKFQSAHGDKSVRNTRISESITHVKSGAVKSLSSGDVGKTGVKATVTLGGGTVTDVTTWTETKAGSACQMTKAIAYHPADQVKKKRGQALPMPDEDSDDDADDTDDNAGDSSSGKGLATKGAYLGDTDEMMCCAAMDRLLSALGYYLFACVHNDDPVAETVDNAGGAIDEFKETLTGLLSSVLIDDDPEDDDDDGPDPTDMVSGSYPAGGYGYRSATLHQYTLKYLAKLGEIDTSRDRAVAALSLGEASTKLISDAGEILDGYRRHFAVRVKEGRILSSATRQRIKTVLDGISPLVTDLEALLNETEPKPKENAASKNGKSVDMDAVLAARIEFARHDFLTT